MHLILTHSTGETHLGDRREKVMLDLSKLMTKVEEFNDCGAIVTWLMELFVSQVQKKINELTGEIEFINKEEELFQWEISNYCEIEQVRKNK